MRLRLRTVNLGLAALLILVMGTQLGLPLPLGKLALPITLADVVLAAAAVGVATELLARRLRKAKLPPLQGFALVAVACVALARSASKPEAAREVLQAVEYFLVAFAVFLNVAERGDLKLLLIAFTVAVACVVLWAGWHYAACASALDVRAGFRNRNALGAFLALSLPVLYGLALHARGWGLRLLLLAIVAAGLLVNLSGGALLATGLALGLLSVLHARRTAWIFLGVAGLALLAAPRLLPRPYHTDVLFSSVAPFVRDNFLLGDQALAARAAELHTRAHQVMAENPAAAPPRDLFDARYLMEFLQRRRGGERRLTPEQRALYFELLAETAEAAKRFPGAERDSAFAENRVALRYQRWQAALTCSRTLWDGLASTLFGLGYVDYHAAIEPFRPQAKLQYFSNVPEVYNVATSEPFTHDAWLKALVQTGLVGLLALGWLVVEFLSRALRLQAAAHSELMLGLGLGAAGGILGFAFAGIFTETVSQGLAVPFVFVCALVAIGERIVYGQNGAKVEQITSRDY